LLILRHFIISFAIDFRFSCCRRLRHLFSPADATIIIFHVALFFAVLFFFFHAFSFFILSFSTFAHAIFTPSPITAFDITLRAFFFDALFC